jgi:hypothetical protein
MKTLAQSCSILFRQLERSFLFSWYNRQNRWYTNLAANPQGPFPIMLSDWVPEEGWLFRTPINRWSLERIAYFIFKDDFMANKLHLHFLLLAGIIPLSCEKEIPEEALTESLAVVDQASAAHLLFEETFEGPAPFYKAHNTEFGAAHSFAIVSAPVYRGHKAARFMLKAVDPMISKGTRTEVTVVKNAVQKEMWYAFAAYFPADGFAYDTEGEIISQWHQLPDTHLGEMPQSPATFLSTRKDRFLLDTGFNKDQVATEVNQDSRRMLDLGPVTKDTWHAFVFHLVHSFKSDGLIEVWHNGTKRLSLTGGNMYNNQAMPKWKLGIYKWKWNQNRTTDTRKRIIYFDNIRVGNAQATLAEMSPAAKWADNPATPVASANSSFTFVNAEKDQDIVRFDAGAILILSAVGTKRITIRANTKLRQVGSVKFALKGARTYTFTDNARPYALFGDDGMGNYYYGASLPAGSYSLKVTPYAGPDATGIPFPAFSTAFTLKKY